MSGSEIDSMDDTAEIASVFSDNNSNIVSLQAEEAQEDIDSISSAESSSDEEQMLFANENERAQLCYNYYRRVGQTFKKKAK
jgi:hypothetical protein